MTIGRAVGVGAVTPADEVAGNVHGHLQAGALHDGGGVGPGGDVLVAVGQAGCAAVVAATVAAEDVEDRVEAVAVDERGLAAKRGRPEWLRQRGRLEQPPGRWPPGPPRPSGSPVARTTRRAYAGR